MEDERPTISKEDLVFERSLRLVSALEPEPAPSRGIGAKGVARRVRPGS